MIEIKKPPGGFFLVTCQIRWIESGSIFVIRDSLFVVREGVPLMRHIFLWGLCTGEFEILVQVEKSPAPESEGAASEAVRGLYYRHVMLYLRIHGYR